MTVYFDKLIDNYLPTDSGWAFHPDNIVELPTVKSDYKSVIDTTNPLPNAYSQLMFSTTSSTGNAHTYYLNLITSTNGELPQIVKDADASNAKAIKIGAKTKLIFKTNYPYNKDRLKKIVCRCRKEAGTTASLRVGVISVKDEAYITPSGSIGTNDFYDVTINSTTTVSETYSTYIGYVLGTTTNAYAPSIPDVDFPIPLYDGTTDIALVIEVTGGIGNYYIDSIELQDTENSIADLPNGRFVVSSLEGLTEDNKLSPVEKTYIKTMITEIDAEYAGALADGMASGVSSTLLSALATKWDALHAIVDPLLENMGTVSDITSAFDDAFAEYFTAVSTLEEQIALHTAGLIGGLDERSRWEVQISGGPTVPLDSTPITLSAILLKDGADVTNDYAESDFDWHRVSSNTSADLAWRGGVFPTGKTLTITKADLESGRATFLCKFKYLYGESLYYFKTGAVAISEEVPGPQGERGIQGPAGVDGQPSYFHLKYSDDGGVTFTDYLGETPGKYFGTYVDSTKNDSEDPSDYTWVLVKGDDGERGIQGPVGENGLSSYLHIKYSDDGGTTFTANNGEAVGDFLGQYVDNTEADSTDPSDYIWKKIKGEQGTKGDQGPQGNQGVQGPSGTDGLPSYFHVRYSDYSDGTDMNDVGGAYIGTYVDTNPDDSDSKEDYTWVLIKGSQGAEGEQGIPGVNGANGETSYLHIKYSNDGGTTFTANNGETVGEYIGQYVDFTEADSTTPSHYKWVKIKGEKGEQGPQGLQGLQGSQGDQGIQGPKGADGLSSYTHIAYATGVDGENFNVKHFPSATYIGMYVDNDPDDSTSYTSYNWSLIKGADGANGIPGPKGDDGLTAYFHTAWANNSTGTSGFSTTVSAGKLYIGTYTDHTQEDSDDETKYKWVKIKGDTGAQGPQGPIGEPGQMLGLNADTGVILFTSRGALVTEEIKLTIVSANIPIANVTISRSDAGALTKIDDYHYTLDCSTVMTDTITINVSATYLGKSYSSTVSVTKYVDPNKTVYNFGGVTIVPSSLPDGAWLVEGDYFLWSDENVATHEDVIPEPGKDALIKGEIYEYNGTKWVKSSNGDLVMTMFDSFADLANDVDSTVIGNAVIKKLVAIEAFIQNLFAQNATIAGTLKSDNYSETGGIPTAGFRLDGPTSIVKMYEAVFGDQCTFYGKLLHSLLQTREAVIGDAITIPEKTHWTRQSFIDFLTSKSLPSDALVPCTGTYNGNNVDYILKSTGVQIRLFLLNTPPPPKESSITYVCPFTGTVYLHASVKLYIATIKKNGVEQVYCNDPNNPQTKTISVIKGDVLYGYIYSSANSYPSTVYANFVPQSSGYFLILHDGTMVKLDEEAYLQSSIPLSLTYGGTTWNSSSYLKVSGSAIMALLTAVSKGVTLGVTGTLIIDNTPRSIVSMFVGASSVLFTWGDSKEILSSGYYNISGTFTPQSVTQAVLTDSLLPLVAADTGGNGKDIGTSVDRYRAGYFRTLDVSSINSQNTTNIVWGAVAN